MANARQRLDRFINVQTGIPKGQVRQLLAQQRIRVDDVIAQDISQPLDSFSRVMFDGVLLQNRTRRYVLLNKPVRVVSATRDETHRTVIDVLRDGGFPESELSDLHIAGRLDLNSSGLLLLTNDSAWSQALMAPDKKVAKVYEVTLENPISDECIAAFKEGIYFPFEDITTKPAVLERLTPNTGRVTLTEGKYHQIKRMFGRFRNPVSKLHRVAIGDIRLDDSLECQQFRLLTAEEATQSL